MAYLERINAEELTSLACFLGIVLSQSFDAADLTIIAVLFANLADVIETIAAIKAVQASVAAEKKATADDAAEAEQQDLTELIYNFGNILKELQRQNEQLREEIQRLNAKLG